VPVDPQDDVVGLQPAHRPAPHHHHRAFSHAVACAGPARASS